jgi:hypothetical protein
MAVSQPTNITGSILGPDLALGVLGMSADTQVIAASALRKSSEATSIVVPFPTGDNAATNDPGKIDRVQHAANARELVTTPRFAVQGPRSTR